MGNTYQENYLLASTRQEREREFFNKQAEQICTRRSLDDATMLLSLPEPFRRQIGNIQNKVFLDYGCGPGVLSVLAAKHGAARVYGFDISDVYLRRAREAASMSGVQEQVCFEPMEAEHLHYPDECFDVVLGNAILHHVDMDRAIPEIRRVLKPGGVAVFSEPLGNRLLQFIRHHVPYPRKARTLDEKPLTQKQALDFVSHFSGGIVRPFDVFCMFRCLEEISFIRREYFHMFLRSVEALDRFSLRVPGLPVFSTARYMTIEVSK